MNLFKHIRKFFSLTHLATKLNWCYDCIAEHSVALKRTRKELAYAFQALEELRRDRDYHLKHCEALRAQLMNLRAGQSSLQDRTGWEVCAYIPDEVLKSIKNPEMLEAYTRLVAHKLIEFALKGLVHIRSEGKVNALVFEPLNINGAVRAPKWMLALHEGGPEGYHFNKQKAKLIDPGTPEERARRASGC
jgi:hypothetical protein